MSQYNPNLQDSGTSRIFYDSFTHVENAVYPMTLTAFTQIGINPRQAAYMINGWDTYFGSRVRVQCENTTTGTTHEFLKFPLMSDLVAWMNNNVGNDGSVFTEQVIFRVYDEVDARLKAIDKMYGLNRLYTGLVGGGRHKTAVTCIGCKSTWDAGNWMLWNMFQNQYPWYSSLQTWSEFRDQNGPKAIWCGTNQLRRYNLPPAGYDGHQTDIKVLSQYPNRHSGCENWENFQLARIDVTHRLYAPKYLLFTATGASSIGQIPAECNIIDVTWANRFHFRTDYFKNANASGIVFYKAEDTSGGPAEHNCAIYIKPLGIDMININWFDTSVYELEIVFENDWYQRRTFNAVDIADMPADQRDIVSDSFRVMGNAWKKMPFAARATSWDNTKVRPYEVRFRFRHKKTGKVGPLSRSKIVDVSNIEKNSLVPIKFLVRSVPD